MIDRKLLSESRILIVDDNLANIALMERVLQLAGYRNYTSLTDSRKVLDQFRLLNPDLILLDLMMPGMDGYAVLNQLGGWIPEGVFLPVLVITADTTPAARKRATELGAKDFLTKPIDTLEATLRIKNLLMTRWLYRQMESKSQFHSTQAGISKQHLLATMHELARIEAAESSGHWDFGVLRFELNRAVEAVDRLSASER